MELIRDKGPAQKVQLFDNAEALIYVKREEYYGKVSADKLPNEPKRIYEIEYIYYINAENIVYKYQVWKKRIDK